jgi:hypothetical protein
MAALLSFSCAQSPSLHYTFSLDHLLMVEDLDLSSNEIEVVDLALVNGMFSVTF